MTPQEIKIALSRLGGGANKKLGQHFLVDHHALLAIVNAADLKKGDRVLEIGPGLGALTRTLLERGAEVTAIEQDRRFIEYLHETVTDLPLTVVYGDAAQLHWHEHMEQGPWKFVANLPYSITSLALRKALWAPHPPERAVVLVQREVAERAIAKDGKQSLLSLMVAFAASEKRIVRRVPAGAFYPPPKVESAILEIIAMDLKAREKMWGIQPEKIMEIAKAGFAHARKKVIVNLEQAKPGMTREKLQGIWKQFGWDTNVRAEDLKPMQWAELARELFG